MLSSSFTLNFSYFSRRLFRRMTDVARSIADVYAELRGPNSIPELLLLDLPCFETTKLIPLLDLPHKLRPTFQNFLDEHAV